MIDVLDRHPHSFVLASRDISEGDIDSRSSLIRRFMSRFSGAFYPCIN